MLVSERNRQVCARARKGEGAIKRVRAKSVAAEPPLGYDKLNERVKRKEKNYGND